MHQSLFKIVLIALLSLANGAHAETIHCPPIKIIIKNQNIILPGPDQPNATQVYYFKNISKQGVWIDHPIKNPSLSAGWSSYLQAGNWSALAIDRKNFTISCAAINPGKVDFLDCAQVLSVCSPQTKSALSKQKGSAWVAEDLKWNELVKKVKKRGFYLK